MIHIETDTLLTSKEASQRTGLNRIYLCALAQQGKIPAQRLADNWLFSQQGLDAYMALPRKRGRRRVA